MKLSDYIRTYREEHALSQRQFANLCGLSNGYIAMLERETNPSTGKPIVPNLDRLRAIAAATGVGLTELLEQIDDMDVEINPKNIVLSDAERDLIVKFRQLDDRGRRAVLNTIAFELSSDK